MTQKWLRWVFTYWELRDTILVWYFNNRNIIRIITTHTGRVFNCLFSQRITKLTPGKGDFYLSGYSEVVSRVFWEHEIGGSNPLALTKFVAEANTASRGGL